MTKNRIRVGIDVGGTFTKAVAIDVKTGAILGKSTVMTSHDDDRGVSAGIVDALSNIIKTADISIDDIELISHSTTQAINALLESDTFKVGIVAMGVGPERRNVIKRTRLSDNSFDAEHNIRTCHCFLDTSHLISEDEVTNAVTKLRDEGAKVIVATEAFGVDDPSNEQFVMNVCSKLGLPSTASHEISGIYGLEIRTITSAVNASVLPKTFQVADYVEDAIKKFGINSPLMIMKGDGGVTSMNTFRTKPILTILSGPAASVAGALLYQRVTNGIFVEVGGTSTNICVIKNGKPEIRYVTIKDHPTCVRSIDVKILGVAGGSMCQIKDGRILSVGPRSAHIAGLKYSCFAAPSELSGGKIVLIKPAENDSDEYVAIASLQENRIFAITNTCAANALDMIEKDDYAYANPESAKIALKILSDHLGISYTEVAMSIIQTASFAITKEISKILKKFQISHAATQIIGGGGGASVLVPFVAKQLDIKYSKCRHAEIISSIGVASSMLQEELEITMAKPTPEKISLAHKKIHSILIDKGALAESVTISSEYIPEKSILRVSATGNVELDSSATSKSVFSLDEARKRCSEIISLPESLIESSFETGHYFVFTGHVEKKRVIGLGKHKRHHIVILDRFGRLKLSIKDGRIFQGDKIDDMLKNFLESQGRDIAPQVYLLTDLKLVDYSSLTSNTHILDAVRLETAGEGEGEKTAAVIVEI